MGNCLKITRIIKTKNKIEYNYEATGEWKDLLDLNEKMFVEYDINIEKVPNSIAIIPLMCNLLPISWVFDVEIEVDELDKDFYECLNDIKKGYQEMYPSIKMAGLLNINETKKNSYNSDKCCAFFSGGVDAFDTLLRHFEEKPTLITVWGADIKVDNNDGWNVVKNHVEQTSRKLDLPFSFIKSNFRDFINYRKLNKYINDFIKGEWWHEFQHGIGLLGLSAPLSYINGYKTIYIASSFTEAEKGKVTCASDPTIDNYLKFSDSKIIHDGYEFNRQDKIKNIIRLSKNRNKNDILLRVCWQSSSGKNCCKCEKCSRTMLGFIAEKENPGNYGFEIKTIRYNKLLRTIKKNVKYDELGFGFFENIRNAFLDNYSLSETPSELLWVRNIKIKNRKPIFVRFFNKIKYKFKDIVTTK